MAEQDREHWTKLVADFESSDLTQTEFAAERGISFSNCATGSTGSAGRRGRSSRSRPSRQVKHRDGGREKVGSRIVPVHAVRARERRTQDLSKLARLGPGGMFEFRARTGGRAGLVDTFWQLQGLGTLATRAGPYRSQWMEDGVPTALVCLLLPDVA